MNRPVLVQPCIQVQYTWSFASPELEGAQCNVPKLISAGTRFSRVKVFFLDASIRVLLIVCDADDDYGVIFFTFVQMVMMATRIAASLRISSLSSLADNSATYGGLTTLVFCTLLD